MFYGHTFLTTTKSILGYNKDMSKLLRILLLSFFISSVSEAGFNLNQFTVGAGMTNITFKENASTLTRENGTTASAYSGKSSVLPVFLQYEMFRDEKSSYYVQAILPLLTTSKDSYTNAGAGMNFYYKSLSSVGNFSDSSVTLVIKPVWRYYWGLDLGLGYLVYNTLTAKKSDILAEIGPHAGVIYTVNDDYTVKLEASFARALGVQTNASVTKLMIGFCRTLF